MIEVAMTDEEHHRQQKHMRIRRVKKWLRYMPRKATVHKYPFLKWFAASARKRHYLWSFRSQQVVPALYAGFILTFMPLYGVQIPLALTLAIVFRANLMILVALQLISNPATIVFLYPIAYFIGDACINLFTVFGKEGPELMQDSYTVETGIFLGTHGKKAIRYVMATMLGGMVMGYFSGLISTIFYRYFLKKWQNTHPHPAKEKADNAKSPATNPAEKK